VSALGWGARVSADFRQRVIVIAAGLGVDPTDLMACMAFESGETFSPSIRNAAGSGAVGLIQFMPSTAAALGATVEELAALTAEQQLQYVADYFRPWTGRLHNLGDVYGVILWPGMVGKGEDYVLFDKADPAHPVRYVQNRGLDFNADGRITRREAVDHVAQTRLKGLTAPNVWADAFGADLTRDALKA
jgi:hypothetical protein